MRRMTAYLKKEFLEQLRTYKLLILVSVFFLFGLMSPLMAKLLPEMLTTMDLEGFTIQLPPATVMDSFTQFFKNMSQMGTVVLLLVFSGSIARETSSGSLLLLLSKGLSHKAVIAAKYTASFALWTLSFAVAAGVHLGYTFYLFPNSTGSSWVFPFFCVWLFGAFLLAVLLCFGCVFSNSYGSLLCTAGLLGGLLLLRIVPHTAKWNPVSLLSDGMDLFRGTVTPVERLPAMAVAIVGLALFLLAAWWIYRKKEW